MEHIRKVELLDQGRKVIGVRVHFVGQFPKTHWMPTVSASRA